MTISTLFHTQGIRGFKYQKTHRTSDTEYYSVSSSASSLSCSCCGSAHTAIIRTGKTRKIKGLPVGFKKRFFWLTFDAFTASIVMPLFRNQFLFAQALT